MGTVRIINVCGTFILWTLVRLSTCGEVHRLSAGRASWQDARRECGERGDTCVLAAQSAEQWKSQSLPEGLQPGVPTWVGANYLEKLVWGARTGKPVGDEISNENDEISGCIAMVVGRRQDITFHVYNCSSNFQYLCSCMIIDDDDGGSGSGGGDGGSGDEDEDEDQENKEEKENNEDKEDDKVPTHTHVIAITIGSVLGAAAATTGAILLVRSRRRAYERPLPRQEIETHAYQGLPEYHMYNVIPDADHGGSEPTNDVLYIYPEAPPPRTSAAYQNVRGPPAPLPADPASNGYEEVNHDAPQPNCDNPTNHGTANRHYCNLPCGQMTERLSSCADYANLAHA